MRLTASKNLWFWGKLGLIVIIVGASLGFILSEPIKLGLDLRGGVRLILEAQFEEGKSLQEKQDDLDKILAILDNRVNQLGLAEPIITKAGLNRIEVELPGTTSPEQAREIIGRTALLEFKKVVKEGKVGDYEALREEAAFDEEVLLDREGRPYIVKSELLLTGQALADARVQTRTSPSPRGGLLFIALAFNDDGAVEFARAINELNVDDRLAIILDGVIYSAPSISQGIKDAARNQRALRDAVIEGNFTLEEAKLLAIVLRAGALPAPVKIIQEETVGPSLGRDSIQKGILSIIIAGILVFLFMPFYYRLSGLIAVVTMTLNLIILVGVLVALNATLTLPGIAGIILTIGMGVDSNVLIFERVREELKAGKTVRASIEAGYNRALLTIIDSHVTTLVTALILFTLGTGPIKGFAVTLSAGIAINLFAALVGTKLAFDWLKTRPLKRLSI